MERHEEAHESLGFRRVEGVAVSGHVASALKDLADDLVFGHAGGDVVEGGAALAAGSSEGVAVAALLVLKNEGSLVFERGCGSEGTSRGRRRLSRRPMMGLQGV